MKRLFYLGLFFLGVFEILRVYFIMPMPGSQQLDTIDIAYALHSYRWYLRILFLILIGIGFRPSFRVPKKWVPLLLLGIVLTIVYMFNFSMTAEKMFRQPEVLAFANRNETSLKDSTTVLAIHYESETKAYPLRYIIYHHQVRDTIAGKPIMVTYCSVCRTGRIFEPQVNGQPENFRLVGMDHYNAMFEDESTKSWWMQATGEAVAGPMKGASLPELESFQTTLLQYFQMFPFGMVMQPDYAAWPSYDTLGKYEWGNSKSALTGTDNLSWRDKSWVIGLHYEGIDKAYDWNLLKQKRIIEDTINTSGIIIILGSDNQSFSVFKRNENQFFAIQNDTITVNENQYSLLGENLTDRSDQLERIQAYQEFWHSWRTFHPNTQQYVEN